MASSRNHQGAHGIGQTEEQLQQQADAAAMMQGVNETDQSVERAAHRRSKTELDEVAEPEA
jgi:hypothetical protein